TGFAARFESWKQRLTLRILRAFVNLAGGFRLSGRQARGRICILAEQRFRIEVALGRIFEHAVLYTVDGIASFEHCIVKQRVFRGRDIRGFRFVRNFGGPDLLALKMRGVIRSSSSDDAIVIGGVALGLDHRLAASGGASVPIGMLWLAAIIRG